MSINKCFGSKIQKSKIKYKLETLPAYEIPFNCGVSCLRESVKLVQVRTQGTYTSLKVITHGSRKQNGNIETAPCNRRYVKFFDEMKFI